ncbi:DUF4214 domain-containing protein [Rhizobium sp. P44RR-XXIV]|uniref:beta strand repeat-containing protein n=1 Tax=Rhizobium sp. P44RR-XXIV TaxID=1921145 RepID=UPI0009C48DBD|nr:DUF4214 domain-containing protein [Rhizobium sp. P44RR-XXIV]
MPADRPSDFSRAIGQFAPALGTFAAGFAPTLGAAAVGFVSGIAGVVGAFVHDAFGSSSSGKTKPVLLDLDGNGVSVDTLASSSTFLDLDNSGYMRRTAWAGKGDGVLVFDADDNGKVSSSKEFAFTEWDPSANGDLEALRNVFDTNGNGKLDAGDAQWAKFKVMVDGQMVSLSSLGITSIDLTAKGSGQTFSDGSAITGTTIFTKSDGTTGIVGDAILSNETDSHIVKNTVVANADQTSTRTILGYNTDGTLAFQNLVTTSADGRTVQTRFDDDGNGTYDRSQTDVTTVATSGERTRVISNFNADGSLVERTTTVTSADLKTTTTSVDKDGDGRGDQTQTFATNADGSSVTTTKEFSTSGALLQQKLVQSSADGLTKTTKTDADGDGVYEAVTTETAVVAADGSRTRTVKDTSANGTLLSNETTVTSADGRARTVSSDLDGNGTADQKEQTQRTIAANGDVTTVVTTSNGDNSLRGKVTTVAAANGLSTTVSSDLTSDGIADRVHSDVTVVATDGARAQTVQDTSASGVLLSKSVITTSADGKTKTFSVDANGDGAADTLTSITIAADGSTSQTDSKLNQNGTLVSRAVTATSADGLSKTLSTDLDGNGTFDTVLTDVITAGANGARVETVTTKSADGTVAAKTVTTITADSLTQTAQSDVNGDGAFDKTVTDAIVLSAGARTETITARSANGTLLNQTVTTVSADRKTTGVTKDIDGDGHVDSASTQIVAADGSQTTTTIQASADGGLHRKTVVTVSADKLTTTTTDDLNGDGVVDVTTVDQTVLNADGSRTETVTDKSNTGVLLDKVTTVTSGNGLTTTVQKDVNGDGAVDSKTVKAVALNNDGSKTTTSSDYAGTSLTDLTKVTVSANGLTTTTSFDYDGNGTVDRLEVATKTLNADGSTLVADSVSTAGGTLLSKTTSTTTADGKTVTSQVDLDGDGTLDVKTTTVVDATGQTTKTIETYKAGTTTLASRAVTTTSANGLSVTTTSDLDGDGVFEQMTNDVTTLNSDGSRTEVFGRSGNAGPIQQTSVTTSANGLSKTTVVSGNLYDVAARNEIYRLYRAALGREPDASSLSHFFTSTYNFATDAVHIASDLVNSTEFTQKYGTLDNTQFITLLFQNALGRAPDTPSLNDWVGWLNSGTSRALAAQAFADCSEAQAHLANAATAWALNNSYEIYRLYRAALGREPDASSLSHFFTSTYNFATDAVHIASDLVNSTEFTQKYGTLDNTQFITLLFQNALGRAPDTPSLNTWVGWLNSGTSRASAAQAFADCSEAQAHLANAATAWTLNNPPEVLSAVKTTTDVTTLNADGSTTEVVTNTGALANKTATTTSGDGKTVTVTYDIDGNGVVDQKSVTVKNADGSVTRTFSDLASTGAVVHSKTIVTGPDGLGQTFSYDTDGNGSPDKYVTDQTTLTTNGGKSTLEKVYVANGAGTLVQVATTRTNTSADGLTVTTTWDQTGSGTFTKSRGDVTVLNADGSRTWTVSYFTDTTLTSRYLTTTSANGLSITSQSDPTGAGTYAQTSTDVTVINADGTRTRTVSSTKADGSLISKLVTTTNADGLIVSTNEQRTGLAAQTLSDTIEILADGAKRETVTTSDVSGKLLDKTITLTSADKRTVTIDRDANGDGVIDQHQQTVIADSGVTTQSVADYKSAGVKADGSTSITTADGLQTTTDWDLNGDGKLDRHRVTVNTNNADGSKVSVISDTDLTTNKLATTTTIQQSSDGLVRTTSKDVDGDGTIDQVETLMADTTGASVSTVTNNATAQKANYLLAGKVYWKQAIAAKVETDSSVDGRSKTVKYDYDGNGTFEVVMQSQLQIDGSTVATVTETNASGAVIAKGTITTSTDGLITVLSKDSNNDGVIDHTETSVTHNDGSTTLTKVDLNTSSVVTQTVVDTVSAIGSLTLRVTSDGQGRTTQQTVVAADGSSVTTAYNAAGGQVLSTVNANKAGIITSAVIYDPLNTNPWSRVEQTFDASGRKTFEKQFNDDGTWVGITYDVDNTQNWSRVEGSYDTSGRLFYQVNFYDNGSWHVFNYDVTNVQPWSTYIQLFNPAGQLQEVSQYNDDGSRIAVTYDLTNVQPWSRLEQSFDGAGRLVSQTAYNDNGTKNIWYWDPGNVQSWSEIDQAYNSAGTITSQKVIYDDGGYTNYQYNSAGNNSGWQHYDRNGGFVDQWPATAHPPGGHAPVLLDLNGDGHIDLRQLDINAWQPL